tara:strand:- start:1572 stop:4199 length:2628 start_codon:yes stop_codon:yes gene_type:complete
MRRNVELYIQNQKADLFDFEDINITNSIKDIKDIGKVFTDYSQEFTIPASKANNRILRHYYNFDLLDSFDARIKVDAIIKISGSDYREGKLTLMGSTLKKGMPYSYRVVFYGKTVSLKDLIGDDELDDLSGTLLDNFNFNYSDTFVKESLVDGKEYDQSTASLITPTLAGDFDLCFPFISSESFYFYDSGNGTSPKDRVDSRNIWDDSGNTGTKKGIYYKDLKPAIRLYWIIKAIEQKYSIQFSNDFFTSTNATFYDLFMLLHRESGSIGNQLDITSESFKLGQLTLDSGDEVRALSLPFYTFQNALQLTNDQVSVDSTVGVDARQSAFRLSFRVSPNSGATGNYNLKVTDEFNGAGWSPLLTIMLTNYLDDPTIFFEENIDGSTHTDFEVFFIVNQRYYSARRIIEPKIEVSTLAGISSYSVTNIQLDYYERGGGGAFDTSNPQVLIQSGNYSLDSGNQQDLGGGVVLSSQMPKIKTMDFLSSLFKTFNLTAYFVPDNAQDEFAGQIRVRTVDSFFQNGDEIDITTYVDTEKLQVDRNNLFSEINFEFEKASTFSVINANQFDNKEFGNAVFNSTGDSLLAFDGGKYDIKPKFEKVMYERMSDQVDELVGTDAQWGWLVNESQNPVLTKPLIFYPIRENISFTDGSGDSITSFLFDSSTYDENGDIELPAIHSPINNYIRPSNSLINKGQSINFDSENDEWYVLEGDGMNNKSLYSTFYSKYISSIYDVQGRTLKMKANLPVSVVLDIEPNDTLVIKNRKFKINKIKLNVNTGAADLELINDTVYSAASPEAPVIQLLLVTNTKFWILISDENAGNQSISYEIYLDNSLYATVNNNAPAVSGLTSGNTYSVKVKSAYPNGIESDFSNTLTVTTL